MPFLWGWLCPLIIASLACEQSYQGKGTPSLQIPSGIMSHYGSYLHVSRIIINLGTLRKYSLRTLLRAMPILMCPAQPSFCGTALLALAGLHGLSALSCSAHLALRSPLLLPFRTSTTASLVRKKSGHLREARPASHAPWYF